MRDEGDSAEASEPIGGMPDADNVASRAEGRPPEEQTSEDPAAQAEAVFARIRGPHCRRCRRLRADR